MSLNTHLKIMRLSVGNAGASQVQAGFPQPIPSLLWEEDGRAGVMGCFPHKSSILRVPTRRKTETCARERHLTCAMFLPTQLCSSGAEPTLLLLEAGHKLQNPVYLQLPAYPLSRATTLPSNTHYRFQTLASQKENCLRRTCP